MVFKKSYKPVSRILSWAIIYLSRWLPAGINLPTLYLGRAVLKRYYTWHFSMQGLPANDVTIKSRRLLPYVFTFVPPKRDSYFLWHSLLVFTPPGSSPVHCSLLSGLSYPSGSEGSITRLVAGQR